MSLDQRLCREDRQAQILGRSSAHPKGILPPSTGPLSTFATNRIIFCSPTTAPSPRRPLKLHDPCIPPPPPAIRPRPGRQHILPTLDLSHAQPQVRPGCTTPAAHGHTRRGTSPGPHTCNSPKHGLGHVVAVQPGVGEEGDQNLDIGLGKVPAVVARMRRGKAQTADWPGPSFLQDNAGKTTLLYRLKVRP
jgi:hypothetical protein